MLAINEGILHMSAELANMQLPPTITVSGQTYNTKALLSAKQIRKRVSNLGAELADHYSDRGSVHALTVMNGALHFASDLRRSMQRANPDLPMTSDQVRVSSYTGTRTSGVIRTQSPLSIDVEGRHVLLIEDIYDTGLTLSWLAGYIAARKPASLEVAVAFDKDKPHQIPEVLGDAAIHAAFKIPDAFVVGYGLDLDQQYRDLEGVYELLPATSEAP